MSIETIFSYLGFLGFGGVIGIAIKSFLDRGLEEKKMLFRARVSAYKGLCGRMLNLFNELDLNSLPEAVRVSRIHGLFSELCLVGSNELIDVLYEYKKNLFEYHNELEEVVRNKKKDETKLKKLYKQLVEKTLELHDQMRKDIYIDPSKLLKRDADLSLTERI